MAVAIRNGKAPSAISETVDVVVPIAPIELAPLTVQVIEVQIVGTAPLIMHSFGPKARRQILEDQQRPTEAKKAPKAIRSPESDYMEARHISADGTDGIPTTAFKSAIVTAARHFAKITMEQLKVGVTVLGNEDGLVDIIGTPRLREDYVRIGNFPNVKTDLRYRPEYPSWGATLRVRYIAEILTARSVVALVSAAGEGGVGEWRPSSPKAKNGSFGTFAVVVE